VKTTCYVLLGLITLGLLLSPLLPFVNTPTLWFGLPAIMVWMGVLVLLITPVLAALEFSRPEDDA
jgi:hypothetical protein